MGSQCQIVWHGKWLGRRNAACPNVPEDLKQNSKDTSSFLGLQLTGFGSSQFYPIAMAPHLALPGEDVISRTIESLRRVAAQVTEDEAPWKDHRMPDVTRLVFSGDQLIGEPQ